MGCCGSSESVGYNQVSSFPPLEEDIDANLIVREYPSVMLETAAQQKFEDIKTYRVVLIGDKKVGKSQMIEALQKHSFSDEYEETIEQEVMVMHKVPITNNTGLMMQDINDFYDCLLKIMDTAGMNDPTSMNTEMDVSVTDSTKLREWIIKGHIFIIVFDLTNKNSFEHIPSFLDEIAKCKQMDNPPIVLVGNKSDLVFNEQYAQINNNYMKNSNQDSTLTSPDDGRDAASIVSSYADLKGTTNTIVSPSTIGGPDDALSPSADGTNGINGTNGGAKEPLATHTKNVSQSVSVSSVVASNLTMLEHNERVDERQVSENEIFSLCQEFNIPYVQCSAKTKYNIQTVFNIAIKESLLYQEFFGKDMRKWMRIKRTMSLQKQDGHYSLHN